MMRKIINLPHLADQIFGVPQYATRQLMETVKSVIVPRLQGVTETDITLDVPSGGSAGQSGVPQQSGVAVIPVHGILVPRRGQIDAACTELTSYERLRSQIYAALNDPSVSEIVLDINSGGGMATGCKELADYIFASRDSKPVTAIVNFNAFSAAYFLASACGQVIVSQTGGVGSVGVLLEHMETAGMEAQMGIKFTTFFRGDHKNDGSPHEPLTDLAIAAINARMDDMYQVFTTSVAEYRGMDVQAVTDTQAAIYQGQQAIDAGLADLLMPPQDAINMIAQRNTVKTGKSSIQVRAAVMAQQMRM
ncbi:S49 family peptidase [Salmonella enterica]|nr:S49 family peptidase [Salmonella enterica]EBA9765543.1 S49 family peptidase [Salmonella enterica]EEB5699296.1 S49 family peptidase [Salmonella enterica]EGX5144520.1 S49 family peptidase [Salmonella enterica]ELF4900207.1 S49 family peptidase [Salmonella enterica]